MAVKFKLRRDIAIDWATKNPVLSAGEPGLEIDTGLIKVGDGIKAWDTLPYFLDTPATVDLIQNMIDNAVLEGVPGDSAYQVAVNNGFVGTETEWLASLEGTDGTDGESAYQVALNNGFVGTETQWLASLHGTDGVDYTGPTITVSSTPPSSPSVGDIWIDTSE